MNKARRRQLAEIEAQLAELSDRIEQLQDIEVDAHHNLAESLQQSARGQAMELASEQLGTALDALDDALQALSEAQA